jgi:putative transposase
MSNHFHILLRVPARQEISDAELVRRLGFIYEPHVVAQVAGRLQDFREALDHANAEKLKASFTYRMYDISEFFKTLKQRFSQWYNTRNERHGTLWEQRFKSVLVEGSEHALRTVSAYIDLNPVRARIVEDPKDYRFCGYGAAVGGSIAARKGLGRVMREEDSWGRIQCAYRKYLYIEGRRRAFKAEHVEKVLSDGGKLPIETLLRCRVRYFSDGVALGSRVFVESVFERCRGQFGPRRREGAQAMRYGEWKGLCTMRDLRFDPISVG